MEKEVLVTPDELNQDLEAPLKSENEILETESSTPEMEEKVISITRVSRTQAGGRRIRFRAAVVVGNRHGEVGFGIGKASEITAAVAKGSHKAKKALLTVPVVRHTIPHEVIAQHGSSKVLLKPAGEGTSIIAGGSVRSILELAGVENVVSKCLTRSTNKINIAYATLAALKSLRDIREIAPRAAGKSTKKTAKTESKPTKPRGNGDDSSPAKTAEAKK